MLTVSAQGDESAASGDLDLTSQITIAGAGVDTTIIDGNGQEWVFDVLSNATTTLHGVTIQGRCLS